MKAAALFALIVAVSLGGMAQPSSGNVKVPPPTIELHARDCHIRLGDDLYLSMVIRSRERSVTIWNSLGWWNYNSGFGLQVLGADGREMKRYYDPYEIIPPSESGAGELVTVGGNIFVGFDSKIPAKDLFTKPGRFILRCTYTPSLPRGYFPGVTIWGTEDGPIESPPLEITIDTK
jgi:hypothetical protein